MTRIILIEENGSLGWSTWPNLVHERRLGGVRRKLMPKTKEIQLCLL